MQLSLSDSAAANREPRASLRDLSCSTLPPRACRDLLVVPGVGDAPVHVQLVTLHLVELVACVGVLP